MNKKRDVKLE